MPVTTRNGPDYNTKRLLRTAHHCEIKFATSLPAFDPSMDEKVGSDKEDDGEVDSPLMEVLYLQEGQQGLITMMNFTTQEIDDL